MKTKNKKYTQLLNKGIVCGLVCSALLFFSSCEDMLTEKPYNYTAMEEIDTPFEYDLATANIYETLSSLNTYGQNWLIYDTDTDISQMKDAGTPGSHVGRDLGHYYNITPTNSLLQDTWATYYSGINQANFVIGSQSQVKVTNDAEAKQVNINVAEAKVLRSLFYFDLIRLFGDLPFRLKHAQAGENFLLARTDREIIYDQIIGDMKESCEVLPWYDEAGYISGRISKGAAYGLLARIYMFRAGYSLRQNGERSRPANYKDYYKSAMEYADKVISSGKHALNESYETVFKNYCTSKMELKESMFEIQFFNPTGQKKCSGLYGTYIGPEIAQGSKFGRANSFIKTTNLMYQKYVNAGTLIDLRQKTAIATYSYPSASPDTPKEIAIKTNQIWSPGKWRRDWQTGTIKDNNNTDVNFCLIRYADVLLLYAEAQSAYNDKPDATAIEYVNQVRRRAFGQAIATPNVSVDIKLSDYADHASFLTFLQDERARELCFENNRRMDLIRWNILYETVKKATDDFEVDKLTTKSTYSLIGGKHIIQNTHELYPIPDRDRRESQYMLSQNPGYTGYSK